MNNRIRDAFERVHAEDALKRGTLTTTLAAMRARSVSARRSARGRRLALVFACLTLALGIGGWRFYVTPVSAISVDVNPSIELGINRFDRIVSTRAFNEDGTALAGAVDLRNLTYYDGLDAMMHSDALKPYLENDGLVVITVIGNTEEKGDEMRERIAACDYAARPNVQCQRGNRDEVAAAHAVGLSFGKYRAFLQWQALDPTVSADDARALSMRQIADRIAALSGEPADAPHGGAGGAGNGGNGRQHRGGD